MERLINVQTLKIRVMGDRKIITIEDVYARKGGNNSGAGQARAYHDIMIRPDEYQHGKQPALRPTRTTIISEGHMPRAEALEEMLSEDAAQNALFIGIDNRTLNVQSNENLQSYTGIDINRFGYVFPAAPVGFPRAVPDCEENRPLFEYRRERAVLNYQILISNMILLSDSGLSSTVLVVPHNQLKDAQELANFQHGFHWVHVPGAPQCRKDLKEQYIHRIQHTLWARICSLWTQNDIDRNAQELALRSDSNYFENRRYREFVDSCKAHISDELGRLNRGDLSNHQPVVLLRAAAEQAPPAEERKTPHLKLVK